MPMRDYDEFENVKIPAEQERIVDIICDAWEECRATDCQSECKDNQVLPCEDILFACTALKYSRKIHEAGYAPAKWIDVKDRLPETSDTVLVVLARAYDGSFYAYSTARFISFGEDGSYWTDDKFGYLEWSRYSDGYGGCSRFKVIAWMPIPAYTRDMKGVR